MKEKVTILAFLLTSLIVGCNLIKKEEHMKFMGISMGCSIEEFQEKLLEKGVKPIHGNLGLDGVRVFSGVFDNKRALMSIFYDSKSKIVYQCGVNFVECKDPRSSNSFQYSYTLKNRLDEKYYKAKRIEQPSNPNMISDGPRVKYITEKGVIELYDGLEVDGSGVRMIYIDHLSSNNREDNQDL